MDIFVEEKEQKEEYASEQYWKELLLLSKYQYHDKLFLLFLSSVLL
jgi:hypothetical protein